MTDPSPAIITDRLSKTFPSRRGPIEAVRGVSLQVQSGEIFGLLGPNGAGKTTTMRMLTTLLPSTAGSATVAGFDVAVSPSGCGSASATSASWAVPTSWPPARRTCCSRGASTARASPSSDPGSTSWPRFSTLPASSTAASRPTRAASGGDSTSPSASSTSRRCSSSTSRHRARPAEPGEPVGAPAGLRDRGTTIVLTTHYLEEADMLCDRLVIVDHGQIVIEGTPRDLKQRVAGDAVVITLKDEADSARPRHDPPRKGALRAGDLRLGRPAPALRRGRQRRAAETAAAPRSGQRRGSLDEPVRAHARRRLPAPDRTVAARHGDRRAPSGGSEVAA